MNPGANEAGVVGGFGGGEIAGNEDGRTGTPQTQTYKICGEDWTRVDGGTFTYQYSTTCAQVIANIVASKTWLNKYRDALSIYSKKQGEDLEASELVKNHVPPANATMILRVPKKESKLLDEISGGAAGGGGAAAVNISSPMDAGSLPAGMCEDIGKAIKSIVQGQYSIVNGTIVLNEVKWPCATNRILYIRDCYDPLFDDVLDQCRRKLLERDHLYVLSGQPGVGKSVFSWYVIFKLLSLDEHKKRTIMYLHQDLEGKAVIIDRANDIIRVVDRSEVFVDQNNTIQISDTTAPIKLDCPTLWVGSPGSLKKEEVKEIRSRFGPDWSYMPLSSLNELLDMHSKAVFSSENLSRQAVLDRVTLWGPVFRQVAYRHTYRKQEALWSLIQKITPEEIEKSFACVKKSEGDGRNPHHSLFLERAYGQDVEGLDLRSVDYYLRGSPIIASAVISNWLINAMEKHKTLQKADFIMWSAGVGEDGSKRGTAFEELSLKVLEQGGAFKVRELGKKSQASIYQIHLMQRVAWKQKLSVNANTLIVPGKRNETGFDALMWLPAKSHHVVVDFTVSEKHGIHQRGLAENLGWNGNAWLNVQEKEVPYIWVVPEDRFESWTRPQNAKDGTKHEIGKFLKQYVMEMPYASLFKIFASTRPGAGKSAKSAGSKALMPEDILQAIRKSSPDISTGGFGAGAIDMGNSSEKTRAHKRAEGAEQQSRQIQSEKDGHGDEERGRDGGSSHRGDVDSQRRKRRLGLDWDAGVGTVFDTEGASGGLGWERPRTRGSSSHRADPERRLADEGLDLTGHMPRRTEQGRGIGGKDGHKVERSCDAGVHGEKKG